MSATTVPHCLSRWWCQSAGLASLCVALRGAASRLAVADALRLLPAGATEPLRLPTVSTPTLCAATTHTLTMAVAYLYASPVDTPLLTVTCGGACMRVEHGAVFEVRCNPIQHDGGLPMHRHDVQARGGGGAAERLHASCRSLGAVPEVEGLERGQAAQCSHPYVRHVDAVVEAETRECRQVAHCPHALVCHRAAKEEVERVQSGCSQLAAPTSVTAT